MLLLEKKSLYVERDCRADSIQLPPQVSCILLAHFLKDSECSIIIFFGIVDGLVKLELYPLLQSLHVRSVTLQDELLLNHSAST